MALTAISSRGEARARRRRGDGRAAAAFLAPTVGGFTIFTLIPIVGSLAVAFTVWPLIGEPTFAGFSNFTKLLTDDPLFLQTVVNTLVFTIAYVPLNIALSLAMASWI